MKINSISPWTGQIVYEKSLDSLPDVEKALSDLDQHYKFWSGLQLTERLVVIRKFHEELKKEKESLAQTICQEMGKPILQAHAEVKKCIDVIDEIIHWDLGFLQTKEIPSKYTKSFKTPKSMGVLLAIMPWNFPLWQALRMIIPSLLTGNVVLLKHSEITPLVGDQIQALFARVTEMTLVRHVIFSHDLTEKIISDSRVKGVSFTGSTRAGQRLAGYAGQSLKKGVFELGGSDAYVILDSAQLENTTKIIIQSRLQNTGQSCIAAKRALVPDSLLNDFLHFAQKEILKYNFGDPLQETTRLGPLASLKFKSENEILLKTMLERDYADLIFSHKSTKHNTLTADFDCHLALAKNVDWFKDKEFFAPILMVFPFKTQDQALEIANSTHFGLGGAVFSEDENKAIHFAQKVESGLMAVNDLVRSELNIPFGGVKNSGIGREMGIEGFLEFTNLQVVSVR